MSNKNWDPNLTPEQNYILKQEGTESPGSSSKIMRNVKVHIIALGVELNYLTQTQNMRVVLVGLLFFNQYQMSLKKKLICILAILE